MLHRRAYLGNRDASARCLADLTDLAASATNDAANHVSGNADVLRLDLFTVLIMSRRTSKGCVRIRTAVVGPRSTVAEVGAIACSHHTRAAAVLASAGTRVVSCSAANVSSTGWLSANDGVVENGASATLPVIYQALADLPHRALDTLGRTLNLDNSLGRLREHLFLRDHAHTGSILDVLDLETLSSDNGTHLIMRDEELDGYTFAISIGLLSGMQRVVHTMCAVALDNASHTHGGSAFE